MAGLRRSKWRHAALPSGFGWSRSSRLPRPSPTGDMENLNAPSPSLKTVLTTDELSRRPSREPDFEAVNQAFISLLSAGLRSPESILQRHAELLLLVCGAQS